MMKNRIRKILKEGEFDWVSSGSDGTEFREVLNEKLRYVSNHWIDDLEVFIVEFGLEKQNELIELLSNITHEVNDEGRDEGYEDGYESGRDHGYDEGWSDGHGEGYDEGYAEGGGELEDAKTEAHDEGREEGYEAGQDDCD